MTYCIEIQNLSKLYPLLKGYRDVFLHPFQKQETSALNGVNLQIKKGELFGLLGANGAGKTTLLKILCTLVLPTTGRALINGLDVTMKPKMVRRLIGYVVCDERSFYWRLTGKQNLIFFARLNGIPQREVMPRVDAWLNTVGLNEVADRWFKDYSAGMRKRLAIARGLLTDSEIIIMDEPMSSLDPVAAQSIRRLIIEDLVAKHGKTVVLATHNLHEAEILCDRVAFLDQGKVAIVDTVHAIKAAFNPAAGYIIELEGVDPQQVTEKLRHLTVVKQVIFEGVIGGRVRLEVDQQANMSQLIEQITSLGILISSFYKKQGSLEEAFSQILDKRTIGDI